MTHIQTEEMTFKEKAGCIIAIVLFLFFAAFAAIHLISLIQTAFGENYEFNMSGFENETKLLDKCIANNQAAKNITKAELEECYMIYGGIDVNQTPTDFVRDILGIPKENDTGNYDIIVRNSSGYLILPFLQLQQAHGQDVDPRYYCMQKGYPYEELCRDQQVEQEIDKVMNDLLERAKQWNREIK